VFAADPIQAVPIQAAPIQGVWDSIMRAAASMEKEFHRLVNARGEQKQLVVMYGAPMRG